MHPGTSAFIVQAGLDQSRSRLLPHGRDTTEAAVSCSNAELLPAPGGRQSPAARPAAVHGQLQVYHLLSSESSHRSSPSLPLAFNVSYFIR